MKNTNKIGFIGMGILLVGGILVPIFRNFSGFTELTFKIAKIALKTNLSGLSILVDVVIKNPTRGTMTITQPFVRVVSGINNAELATSSVIDKTHILKPLSETRLDTIAVEVSWLTVAQMALQLKNNLSARLKTEITNPNLAKKLLFIGSNFKSVLSDLKLQCQFTAYCNGVFYKSNLYPLI